MVLGASINVIEGNNIVNTNEDSDGILITGTFGVSPGETPTTITVTVNGTPHIVPLADIIFDAVSETGTWSLTLAAGTTPSAGNPYLTSVTIFDSSAASSTSNGPVFNVDLDAPAAPIVQLNNDTGTNGTDFITSDGTLSVTAAETGGVIEYSTDMGTTWSDTVPTATEGPNTIFVRQVDDAGNEGASTPITFTLDTMGPVLTITDGQMNAVHADADGDITFTFTFDTPVSDFDGTDISVANATAGVFTAVSATEYTLTVTPNADLEGDVTVSVAANAATDAAGNGIAATSASQTVDNKAPILTITDGQMNAVHADADGDITFTFTFDTPVSDFDGTDISIANGTAGVFTAVSATEYTLTVTPNADLEGDVTVSVAANAATDAAGNGIAATSASQTVDNTADVDGNLAVAFIGGGGDMIYNAGEPIQVEFSGIDTDIATASITVVSDNGGSVSRTVAVDGTITLTPAERMLLTDGNLTVTFDVEDNEGNTAQESSNSFSQDTMNPTLISAVFDDVELSDADDGNTVSLVLTFSEDMDTTDANALTVGVNTTAFTGETRSWNGTTDTLTVTYTFNDTNIDIDNLTVDVDDAADVAGNAILAVVGFGTNSSIDTLNPTSATDVTSSITIDEYAEPSDIALSGQGLLTGLPDSDAGGPLSYSFGSSGNPGMAFGFVTGATVGTVDLIVTDPNYFDFEDRASIPVDIIVTDAAGNTTESTFTVNLNDINDNPEFDLGTSSVAETVIERADTNDAAENDPDGFGAEGSLFFTDDEITDTHSVSVTNLTSSNGDFLGLFIAGLADPSAGDGNGRIDWNFNNVTASQMDIVDALAVGETITQTYDITVTDNNGGVGSQTVTITIQGTNDAPLITAASTDGSAEIKEISETNMAPDPVEGDTLSDTGTLTFSDIDTSDMHTAGIDVIVNDGTGAPIATPLGALTLGPLDQTSDTVEWTFTVSDAAIDYLGEGDTVVQVYTVTIDDMNGGTAEQEVSVTITGTNDLPVINTVTNPAGVTENTDASTQALSIAGNFTVDDVDVGDVLTGAVSGAATAELAGNDISGDMRVADFIVAGNLTFPATATNDGTTQTLNFDFAANGNLDFLRDGEILTLTYAVTVGDGTGVSTPEDVVITITGTNDVPTITAATVNTTNLVEDGTDVTSVSSVMGDVSSEWGDLDATEQAMLAVTEGSAGADAQTALTFDGSGLGASAGEATISGTYGSLYIAADGSYRYVLDDNDGDTEALNAGDSATDTFNYTIANGATAADMATSTITVNIDGSNDQPTISGAEVNATGLVEAGLTLGAIDSTSGDVSTLWNDVDDGETVNLAVTEGSAGANAQAALIFNAMTGEAAILGTYGTLYLSEDGTYRYELDDTDVDTQGLNEGDMVSEVFNYTIANGATASNMASSTITVDITGTNDAPDITFAVGDDVGSVTEAGIDAMNMAIVDTPTATGTLDRSDVDSADDATNDTWSIDGSATGTYGTLAIDQNGVWTYTLDNTTAGAADMLAAGESDTETFTVRLSDNDATNEGTDTQVVTITVNGTNDAPIITASGSDVAVTLNDVAETAAMDPTLDAGPLTSTGNLAFDDVDASNTFTAAIDGLATTGITAGIDGAVDLSALMTLSSSTVTEGGGVTWNFNGAETIFDYLADGENLVLTYTISVTDNNGGVDTQEVAVTIQGSNDEPIIVATDISDDAEGNSLITVNGGGNAIPPMDAGDDIVTIDLLNDAVDSSMGAAMITSILEVDASDTQWIDTVSVAAATDAATTAALTATGFSTGDLVALFDVSSDDGVFTYDRNALLLDRMDSGESVTVELTYSVNSGTVGGVADTEIQTISLTITGANDAPYFLSAPTSLVGSVNEEDDGSAGENAITHTESGTIRFDDLELNDGHTVTILPVSEADTPALSDYIGNLSSGFTGSAMGANEGEIIWSYSVADSVIDNLTEGETITQRYRVSIDDGDDSVSEDIVITITGTNDAPDVTGVLNNANAVAAPADFSLVEDGGVVDTEAASVQNILGTIVFDDIDVNSLDAVTTAADMHSATATVSEVTLGGVVQMGYAGPTGTLDLDLTAANASNSISNNAAFDFEIADSDFDFLTDGEVLEVTFTVTIDDGRDANNTTTQDLTFVITGTNDAPMIANATVNGTTLVEDGLNATTVASVTGSVAGEWSDADAGELAMLEVTEGSAGLAAQAGLSFNIMTGEAEIVGTYGSLYIEADGSYRYELNDADADTQGLNEGEMVTDVFNYTTANGSNADDMASSTITVNIMGTNDAPDITATAGAEAGSVTETGINPVGAAVAGPASATGTLTPSDVDTGDNASNDAWSITAASGQTQMGTTIVIGTYGTLSIDQAGVWTYTLNNASADSLDAGDVEMEAFTVQLSDNDAANEGTDTQTITITVNGTNDAPVVAGALTESVNEDAIASIDMLAGATDIDADDTDLTVANLSSPLPDGVTFDGTSTLTLDAGNAAYQSLTAGVITTAIVSFDVIDGNGGIVSQTATFTITGTNDQPTISAAEVNATGLVENGLLTGGVANVAGNVSSLWADADMGETADLMVVDGSAGADAQASLTFDGSGLGASAGEATIIGTYGSLYIAADGAYRYVLDDTDTDTEGLNEGEMASELFNYTISNTGSDASMDAGDMATSSITVNITGTNDAPDITVTGTNDAGSVTEAGVDATNVAAPGTATATGTLNASDVDSGDDASTDTWSIVTPATATYGTLSIDQDGAWTYTLDNTDGSAADMLAVGDVQTDTFTVQLSDNNVTNPGTDTQVITITVTGTNDAPVVAAALSASAIEDGASVFINMLDGASDIDTGSLISVDAASVSTLPAGVTFDNVAGLTLDPTDAAYQSLAVGESTTVTVNYNIVDGLGGVVAQAASFVITGTNDIPTVAAALSDTVTEDDGALTFDLLSGANDVDASDVLTIQSLSTAVTSTGDLALTLVEGVDYTLTGSTLNLLDTTVFDALDDGESAALVFNYNVDDDNGGVIANTQTVSITGVNDAPEANDDAASVNEGAFALFNVVFGGSTGMVIDTDVEGDALTLVSGTDVLDAASGEMIAGGSASVSSAVPGSFFTEWGAEVTLQSNGLINYNVTSSSALFNTLAAGQTAVDTFIYTISDGDDVDTATVSVTITGTNDPITANADSITFTEGDAPAMANLTDNDTDVDVGPTATKTVTGVTAGPGIVSVTPVTGGFEVSLNSGVLIMVNNDGTYDVTAPDSLNQGELVSGQFTYTVQDDGGSLSSASVNVNITGTNDTPTVAAALVAGNVEDSASLLVDLLDGADDLDSAAVLSVTNVSLLPDGFSLSGSTLTVDAADIAYQSLAAGQTLVQTVTYDVVDVEGASVSQSVTVTITGTNDAPVVAAALSEPATEDGVSVTIDMLDGASDVDTGAILLIDNVDAVLPAGVTFDGTSSLILDPADAAYQSLAQGETTTVTVAYDVIDGVGGVTPQTASFVVTGTNDAPVVTVSDLVSVTESDVSDNVTIIISDQVEISDVDTLDTIVDYEAGSLAFDSATGPVQIDSNIEDLFTLDIVSGEITYDRAAFNYLAASDSVVATFTFTSASGPDVGLAQSLTVTVTGENDAPVVAAALSETVAEDTASVTIDMLDGASDVDTGAVISVDNVDEVLPAGVIFDGTSNLTFDPTDEAYQSLAVGETVTVTVSYDVIDGEGPSGVTPQTASFVITGTNDVPVVEAELVDSAEENFGIVTIDLLEGASDIDASDELSISNLSVLPAGVSVSGSTLTVDTNHVDFESLSVGASELISISFDIIDGNGGVVPQTLEFTVTGTNDAPVVNGPLTASATEDGTSVSIDMFTGASDIDSQDILSFTNLSDLPDGVSQIGQSLILDPSDDAFQSLAVDDVVELTITYNISDGIVSVPQTVTFTVTGTNDAPVVAAALVDTAAEGSGSVVVDLLAGATDVDDGDMLSITNVSALPAGVTLSGTSLTVDTDHPDYDTLSVGFSSLISISFDIVDGNGGVTPQTLDFTVTGTNDAPVVSGPLGRSIDEDIAPDSVDMFAGASDVDEFDTLSITNVSTLPDGVTRSGDTLMIDPSNTVFQSLAIGEEAEVSVTYDISDGIASVGQTVTFVVVGTNDAPVVAAALTADVTEDGADVSVDLLDGASDVDNGAVLSVTNVSTLPPGVTLDGSTLSVDAADPAYQALADGVSIDLVITYNVIDEDGGSVAQMVTITVTGTNDAPVIAAALSSAATEDGASVTINMLDGASDVDAGAVIFVDNVDTELPAGVTFDGASSLTLDPSDAAYQSLALGETVTVTVSYDVIDGEGPSGVTPQTASFVITGTNDVPMVEAPILAPIMNEDDAATTVDLLSSASDADNDAVLNVANLSVSAGDDSGVTINGNLLEIDPSAYNGLAGGEIVVLTYTYDIVDELGASTSQSAMIEITGSNDLPIVNAVLADASEDGSSVLITGDFSDVDVTDELVVSIDITETLGDVVDNMDGTFTYSANGAFENLDQGATTVDTFTYTVDDGNGGVVTNTVSVTITGVDDAPVITGTFTAVISEGNIGDSVNSVLGGAIEISDVDDGDTPEFADIQGVGESEFGTFELTAGVWSYTLNETTVQDLDAGDIVSDSFVFIATDGTEQSVSVEITGTDDASVVTVVDTGTVTEGDAGDIVTVSGVLSIDDADADDMPEFISVATEPSDNGFGAFDLNGEEWTYILDQDAVQFLNEGENAMDSITFTATDGTEQTITVTILGSDEVLVGDADNNILIGTDFVDVISGLAGDDIIDGQFGLDTLSGGEGDDTFILNASDVDTVDGGDGSDTITFENGPIAVNVDLAAGTVDGSAVLTSVENVDGSVEDDMIVGSADDNIIQGFGGADTLDGGLGDDTVSYAQSSTGVSVELGSGFTSGGDAEGDTITGFENLTGSAFDDTLFGSSFNNVLMGGAGADIINGGGGGVNTASYADAGEGVTVDMTNSGLGTGDAAGDTLTNIQIVSGSDFDDVFIRGNDALSYNGRTGTNAVSYQAVMIGVVADLQLGTTSGGASGDTFENIQDITGSSSEDRLLGNADNNALDGGAGDDAVFGRSGDDVLNGGSGADRLDGGTGNDTLLGGSFADVLIGGAGDDIIDGGSNFDTALYTGLSSGVTVDLSVTVAQDTGGGGVDTLTRIENLTGSGFDDVLTGSSNRNRLEGGSGDDVLFGLGNNDTLIGGSGEDVLWGGTGADRLVGGTGNDDLYGEGQRDRLEGGSGDDNLFGGDDVDRLLGGSGDDTLDGGNGTDFLFGGAGNDSFVFNSVSDSGVGPFNRDEIRDWNDGDLVDISAIDADITSEGDQAFSLVAGGFTGSAGELMIQNLVRNGQDVQLISLDVDGDSVADMQIMIFTSMLDADDFML